MAIQTPYSELNENADAAASDAAVREASRNGDVSILDILVILADRKGLILRITAAFILISIPLVFLLPTRYTATVTVLPPQQSTGLGTALLSDYQPGSEWVFTAIAREEWRRSPAAAWASRIQMTVMSEC